MLPGNQQEFWGETIMCDFWFFPELLSHHQPNSNIFCCWQVPSIAGELATLVGEKRMNEKGDGKKTVGLWLSTVHLGSTFFFQFVPKIG